MEKEQERPKREPSLPMMYQLYKKGKLIVNFVLLLRKYQEILKFMSVAHVKIWISVMHCMELRSVDFVRQSLVSLLEWLNLLDVLYAFA